MAVPPLESSVATWLRRPVLWGAFPRDSLVLGPDPGGVSSR